MKMSIDIETRSRVDLRKCGVYKYAIGDSTDCLCIAYKVDDCPVKLFIPDEEEFPIDFLVAWNTEDCELWAFNATFERLLFSHCICSKYELPPVPTERWFCSMALCYYYNITGGLDHCAKALNIGQRKDKKGSRILLQLAKPRKPSKDNPDEWFTKEKYPEKYDTLYKYCEQDVIVEALLHAELDLPPPIERELYLLDAKINARGLWIDIPSCEKALVISDQYKKKLITECKDITDGISPNQVAVLRDWLAISGGLQLQDLRAETVKMALELGHVPAKARRILEIRQAVSKTSIKKINAFLNTLCPDNRIHGALQYYGASTTGRWAGRLIQPQNLPRGSGIVPADKLFKCLNKFTPKQFISQCENNNVSPLNLIGSAIRGMITAPDGYDMFIADYSGIEARVIAWLAEESSALEIFEAGLCLYKDMAGLIYGIPDPQKIKKDDPKRFVGKEAILSLGYGVGAKKFMNTVNERLYELIKAKKAKAMTKPQAADIVTTYRRKYSNTRNLWYLSENIVLATLKDHKLHDLGKIAFKFDGFFLHTRLPNGRMLRYPACHTVKIDKWDNGELIDDIRYRGHRTGAKNLEEQADPDYHMHWRIIGMYGAKFIQNVCQAIARDIMAEAMIRAESAGFQCILTIHDEIVAIAPKKDKRSEEGLCEIMRKVPVWVSGLPLDVEGKKVFRYCK